MLNQSFSAENFRKILDYENRKGVFLEKKFFPDVAQITNEIKKVTAEIKHAPTNLNSEELDAYRKGRIEKKGAQLKEEKEELLKTKLENISSNLFNQKFKISLSKNDKITDKPVYIQENKPEVFFALKQIQYNLYKLYKVKQANRYAIVKQVKELIGDSFPKFIIRADLQGFYESIPHEKLLKKLNEENLLSFFSKKVITSILKEYTIKSGQSKGLPRGIGISAYLSELYLRDIDNEIKCLPDITYYARYVDDIIVFFTPQVLTHPQHYFNKINEIIGRHLLVLNEDKTSIFDLRGQHTNHQMSFEFLGYKLSFTNSKKIDLELSLSKRKQEKYINRIDLAFHHYLKLTKINEKAARKIFVKRIRFLTTNTRLINNKRHILTGIFYSHSLLNDNAGLDFLDKYLLEKIAQARLPEQLAKRLMKFSFKVGFDKKTFTSFKPQELREVMLIWKTRYQ